MGERLIFWQTSEKSVYKLSNFPIKSTSNLPSSPQTKSL